VWKTIHVAAVILFLGNITTGLFWAAHAHRSRDFTLIAPTFDGISRSDRWFTIPGVIGILASGVAAAIQVRLPILGTPWILWSIMLFSISGIIYGVKLAPLQRQLATLTRAAVYSDQAWQGYVRIYQRWERWGLVALLTPTAAMVIMVLKPALPGL
jgi:uncharacterized membrane protein